MTDAPAWAWTSARLIAAALHHLASTMPSVDAPTDAVAVAPSLCALVDAFIALPGDTPSRVALALMTHHDSPLGAAFLRCSSATASDPVPARVLSLMSLALAGSLPTELASARAAAHAHFAAHLLGHPILRASPLFEPLSRALTSGQGDAWWALVMACRKQTLVPLSTPLRSLSAASGNTSATTREGALMSNLLAMTGGQLADMSAGCSAERVAALVSMLHAHATSLPGGAFLGAGESGASALGGDSDDDEEATIGDGSNEAAKLQNGVKGLELSIAQLHRAAGASASAYSADGPAFVAALARPATTTFLFNMVMQAEEAPSSLGSAADGDAVLSLAATFGRMLVHAPPSSRSTAAVLHTLCKVPHFAPRLWACLERHAAPTCIRHHGSSSSMSSSSSGGSSEKATLEGCSPVLIPSLVLLCAVTSRLLVSVNDDEFGLGQPLSVKDQQNLSAMLASHLQELIWDRNVSDSRAMEELQLALAEARLFNQLYDRHARRDFEQLKREHWLWPPLVSKELNQAMESGPGGFGSKKVWMVLTVVPQVLPFDQRVRVFQQLIESDKESLGIGSGSFLGGSVVHDVTNDRSSVYEDAFDQLDSLGPRLKGRVRVTFASDLGYAEAGIDGGGLFKDFMDGFIETAFDPARGLFSTTEDHLLFPSPLSGSVEAEHLRHFEFMGRVLGKAVYSGILVKTQFALPFLNKLLDRTCVMDDLFGLDPELYRHLMSLKAIAKESSTALEDLTLAFTAAVPTRDGGSREVELIPNGSQVAVTNANFLEYTYRLANFKLNLQTGPQSRAFLRGFRDLIPVDWIRMFDARELQMVIGGQQRALDLDNMREFTAYGGGYHPSQPIIQWFWEVLSELTPSQQGEFLKFVTSCSRQPLLGFKYMQPPFCVQKVPLDAASNKLPTAATCMSLLKLPDYKDKATLKAKLVYAISSNAGFELS